LKDYSPRIPIINEAMALSWDAKFIGLNDFPLMHSWDDRLAKWVTAMDAWDAEEVNRNAGEPVPLGHEDPNLVNRILGFLGYLEDVANEIGIMCIRQITAGRFINLVTKALVVLALLLVALVVSVKVDTSALAPAIVSAPVFFVALSALMLLEIAYHLHREDRENLSFVAWNDDHDNTRDDDQPAPKPLPWHRARDDV
jgi:hypothetical protein